MAQAFSAEELVSAQAADVCVEQARRVLADRGFNPVVEGLYLSGNLGSQIKMRLVGGSICPASWLPICAEVEVSETDEGRLVVVNVTDRVGLGSMFAMQGKFDRYCRRVALELRDAIAGALASAT